MKRIKKIFVVLLALCIIMSQSTAAQAKTSAKSTKKAKYTVTMNKTVYTLKKGKTITLKATLNKAAKKKGVQWTSSNKKVAVVSQKGKVTAKGKGKVTITAKVKGTKVKAVCKIVVGTPVSKVSFNKKNVSLTTGKTFQLKTKITPKKPTNKKLIYSSSNKKVVTVSQKGVIKAVAPGTAKITAEAADGAGAKAVCKVTVADTPVTGITISEESLSLKPGDKKTLTAAVTPADATNHTVTWASTNERVAKVDANGTVTAIGEGSADVTAEAGGKKAACSVKVAYSGHVSNQNGLLLALGSKSVTHIVYTSDTKGTISIPKGDYAGKTLEINAPNADVVNEGTFAKVVIRAIAQNTYHEKAVNTIDFMATQGHIVVEPTGIANINLQQVGQNLQLENKGCVKDLNVPQQAVLAITGQNSVPVTLGKNAGNTYIKTETELDINAQAKWKMAILPGAENTRASISDRTYLPDIAGLGCIPVVVREENDVVNIPASKDASLGISQMVSITGNVRGYTISENSISGEKSLSENSAPQTSIYLTDYSAENADMEVNYDAHLSNLQPAAFTDENGDYTIPQVEVGNYWMVLKKDGYQPVIRNLTITSNNTSVYSSASITLLSDEIIQSGTAEEISGTVIDGLTGNSVNVPGLRIKLRSGSGNVTGPVLKEAYTDEAGNYSMSYVPAGIYTLEVVDLRQNLSEDQVRYNSSTTEIVVVPGLLATTYNCVINQKMQTITGRGQVQFTLTWGSKESGASADIDSHLIGPKADGEGQFHVYYSNKRYGTGDTGYYDDDDEYIESSNYERYADLDVDDINYEGPEHTTIYKETPGVYHFYIHNFSESDTIGSDMMTKSSIQVRITIGSSSYVYNCPNQIGNLWYVCDYNSVTHTIIPKNEMSTFLGSTADIGLPAEVVAERYLKSVKEDALSTLNTYQNNLSIFKENEAKRNLVKQVEAWKTQITNATTPEAVSDIKDAICEADSFGFENPVFTADNLIDGYEFSTQYKYDDDDNEIASRVVQLYADYGELQNLKVSPSEEGQTVTMTPLTDDENYSYLVNVTMTNRLSYDLYVQTVAGTKQAELNNRVKECGLELSVYDSNADIENKKAALSDLSLKISSVNDDESYNKVDKALSEIEDTLDQQKTAFYMDRISLQDLLIKDWDIYSKTIYDDDENPYKRNSTLYIYVYEDDMTAARDSIEKLELVFETEESDDEETTDTSNVSYTITKKDYESDGCDALIKAKDEKTDYVKNINVIVTEW